MDQVKPSSMMPLFNPNFKSDLKTNSKSSKRYFSNYNMCKRDPKCLEFYNKDLDKAKEVRNISNAQKVNNEKKVAASLIPTDKNMEQRTTFGNSATEINNFAVNNIEGGQFCNLVISPKSLNHISMDTEDKNANGDMNYISLVSKYQGAHKLINHTGLRFKF